MQPKGKDSYAMIYLPIGKTVQVDLSLLSGDAFVAWWFNPKDGKASKIGTVQRKAAAEFTPPSIGTGNDWVLVIDAVAAKYPAPGR
nr:putative collagen-binding domain-containing protein [Paraflavitalea sp. H1-2-19X]